jgi:predicted TIM-barrel fold metal-dependent hydrolase
MFGSDWPVCEAVGGWSQWAAAAEDLLRALAPEELDAVLRGTARRFYGLVPTSRAAAHPSSTQED